MLLMIAPASLLAQAAAFTYQGRLVDGRQPGNGNYDLQFRLADSASSGNYVGMTATNAAVTDSNGLFSVTLDFGASVFDGSARWLEIGVRTNGSVGPYTVLSPRQAINRTPYATFANTAASAALATSITPGALAGTGGLTNGSTAANLTLMNPTFATAFDASKATNFNATVDSLPRTFGSEYLYHWFSLLRSNLAATVVFDGDSTTVGGYINNPSYQLQTAVPALIGTVPSALTWVNLGTNGQDVVWWTNYGVARELSANPDLLVVRFGINGPNTGTQPGAVWEPSFRAALAALRAARTVEQMSIVVMSPNPTDDAANGHTAAYHEILQPIIRKAARDYQCAFVDTYSFLKDATWTASTAMDSLKVHPLEEMNLQICGLLADFILPTSIRTFLNPSLGGTNVFQRFYTTSLDGAALVENTLAVSNGFVKSYYQRRSDFNPTSISGMRLWLDATRATNQSGSAISVWKDSSGNGIDAVAEGTGPTLLASGINGHPSMSFASPGNVMHITNTIAGRPITMFFVQQPSSIRHGQVLVNPTTGYYYEIIGTGVAITAPVHPNQAANCILGNVPFVSSIAQAPDGSPTTYIDGVAPYMWVDWAIAGANMWNGGTTFLGGSANGNYYVFAGLIGEILIYDSYLSDTDRQSVEWYLGNKWMTANSTTSKTFTSTPVAASGLKTTNTPSAGQVLKYDGTNMYWSN